MQESAYSQEKGGNENGLDPRAISAVGGRHERREREYAEAGKEQERHRWLVAAPRVNPVRSPGPSGPDAVREALQPM